MLPLWHQHLPSPLDKVASLILLEGVHNADLYLMLACAALTALAFVQLRAFARPPPVPLKILPPRPSLQILFKPDDIASSGTAKTHPLSGSHSFSSQAKRSRRPSDVMRSVTNSIFRSGRSQSSQDPLMDHVDPTPDGLPKTESWFTNDQTFANLSSDEDEPTESPGAESPFLHSHDLPDSFAPLLSSSQMEILHNQLTTDLIHAIDFKGGVRIREGRHEIPLDKDKSRPQLLLDVPKGGCRVTAVAAVGSDGFSADEDLDVTRRTATRSRPMVKNAGLVLDPPLPLANVAPTLIHFPTLFEDNSVPSLRRIQIARFALDLVASLSSFLEKMLWIIESKCQIHLSKVQVLPLYKGSTENNSPEWRLLLAFSGHVLLFGWIPIPFIRIILPTFIIPHPHALIEYLLTSQPLASAKLKRENIAEKRIALAALDNLEGWNVELKAVATPPALGVDVTLPGGVALALELMHGRDAGAGIRRQDGDAFPSPASNADAFSGNSLSSWTTYAESGGPHRQRRHMNPMTSPTAASSLPPFNANELVPWLLELSAKGSISHQKMTVHVLKLSAQHEDQDSAIPTKSKFATSGSFAVWKADLSVAHASKKASDRPTARRTNSFGHMMALASSADSPSVVAILLFLEKANSASRAQKMLRMLQYDYAFDVWDDTQIDAITLSVGASHPMLTGGTMVTFILESIYAFGSVAARDGATFDPTEPTRKRNILRHLPAVDFTFGIQNAFIPAESFSYSDDGQTKCIPEMESGRMMVRIVGGITEHDAHTDERKEDGSASKDGLKLIADFALGSIALMNESKVNEFPELDIFEGTKLISLLSGTLTGRISSHLRPQILSTALSTIGPNIFNPLEAYEIDFSGSSLSFKIKESSTTLGHRRVIIPTESSFAVKVVESIVDMTLEGKTQCELSWDFQGLSPILQVTEVGESPAYAAHENKQQVALLIAALRQGRLNFHVSAVGGIRITEAKTSREDREGLYDWKFFNAIVSPDQGSAQRLLQVLHDKRTMEKLLQVIKLVNAELDKILRYILTQVWRAKEIFDQEGVSDPGHAIPGHKMARLVSLFLCGDVSKVDVIVPIIRRVTSGDGLDVVKVKELLRQHLVAYDDWAPELDRAVRWAAVMLGPMAAPPPYVESEVPPLSELPHHANRFRNIPSARQLYDQIHDKPQLPLDPIFSNLVSRVAPYMSFRQIDYFLQVRASTDWQPSDLRRLRYVYSVKKKVLDISESYGGVSFLPQSFLVSVFLGEATRASLRASKLERKKQMERLGTEGVTSKSRKVSTLSILRRRRMMGPRPKNSRAALEDIVETAHENFVLTPAGRVASLSNFVDDEKHVVPDNLLLELETSYPLRSIKTNGANEYELGDSLLGPQDVAILLQAGLTSAMKGSTVVQLNQRMLLDLIASQPRSFAVAVLAEIGTPGGQGSPRGLTSALMALLELDQSSFTQIHRLDMHALLESWLPGFKIPRREDYLAGGRWARQSFYEAIYGISTNILEDAECYMALKGHIQRDRRHREQDPIPRPREDIAKPTSDSESDESFIAVMAQPQPSKLKDAIARAKAKIQEADKKGQLILGQLLVDERKTKASNEYKLAIQCYQEAFICCRHVLELDKLSFQSKWFREFYRRNFDALMLKSMFDNVIDDVDNVRDWLNALRRGQEKSSSILSNHVSPILRATSNVSETSGAPTTSDEGEDTTSPSLTPTSPGDVPLTSPSWTDGNPQVSGDDNIFSKPEMITEQVLLDAILDAVIYKESERERLRRDPLVRLLIPNPSGKYNFAIVTAMGVITEGKSGLELESAFNRLREQRGVHVIRADTGTARSLEFNAAKIEEAIIAVTGLRRPYGLLGYSQGCANALTAESLLLSGSPAQQRALVNPHGGLVCRQLLFSAANGSMHGPASDMKVQRLIVMCEEFFKYQQGYFSRAFTSSVLETLNTLMDSAAFQKFIGGAQSMLPEGCRVFWREAQHLAHIPTCTLRGVLEEHTTPESLEMIANLLTKQSGSVLHDSQVHAYDAVGYPVYTINRNGRILKNCAVGEGAIQRTHHWSPLSDEVGFVRTQRDVERASFECAKDRHVFPWVDVNVRFGFIHYAKEGAMQTDELPSTATQAEVSDLERPMSNLQATANMDDLVAPLT